LPTLHTIDTIPRKPIMTEPKSTTKKTPATARKAATTETTIAAGPVKPPAARKAPAAEKKSPVKKAVPTPATDSAPIAPPEPQVPATSEAAAKPSAEERYLMVQSAAYFIAEKDGFQGCDTAYWARAEQEVARQLGEVEA
jgi:hypothetical protein